MYNPPKTTEMKDWRYEIKYAMSRAVAHTLPLAIRAHPAGFYSPYPDRTVNNLYLDTLNATSCRENLDGISDRVKFRIRWYGDPHEMVDPVLELKIKRNALGRKEYFPLSPVSGVKEALAKATSVLPGTAKLVPLLHNSYRRSYYVTFDNKYRLTVDRNILYQSGQEFLMGNPLSIADDRVIVEVKFAAGDLLRSKEITRHIPYRVTKHSKYASGAIACLAYR